MIAQMHHEMNKHPRDEAIALGTAAKANYVAPIVTKQPKKSNAPPTTRTSPRCFFIVHVFTRVFACMCVCGGGVFLSACSHRVDAHDKHTQALTPAVPSRYVHCSSARRGQRSTAAAIWTVWWRRRQRTAPGATTTATTTGTSQLVPGIQPAAAATATAAVPQRCIPAATDGGLRWATLPTTAQPSGWQLQSAPALLRTGSAAGGIRWHSLSSARPTAGRRVLQRRLVSPASALLESPAGAVSPAGRLRRPTPTRCLWRAVIPTQLRRTPTWAWPPRCPVHLTKSCCCVFVCTKSAIRMCSYMV
jgi:hypothetical protein